MKSKCEHQQAGDCTGFLAIPVGCMMWGLGGSCAWGWRQARPVEIRGISHLVGKMEIVDFWGFVQRHLGQHSGVSGLQCHLTSCSPPHAFTQPRDLEHGPKPLLTVEFHTESTHPHVRVHMKVLFRQRPVS